MAILNKCDRLYRKFSKKSETDLLAEFSKLMDSAETPDDKKHFELCRALVDKYNNRDAKLQLAKFYFEEYEKVDIPQDTKKALELLLPLAYESDLSALLSVIKIYKAEDDESSVYLYTEKAADQGDADCCYCMGTVYEKGNKYIGKSNIKARKYYKKAAEKGHKKAAYEYALYCKAGSKERFDYFIIAAEGEDGVPAAMNGVGVFYCNGDGGIEKNIAKAVEWYKKAARAGSKWGQYNLACKYDSGIEGVLEQDRAEAFKLFKDAAEGEDAVSNAMNMVGRFYDEGWGGVEQNAEEAFKWYKKAADNGNVSGMNNIAIMFKRGEGCEKDIKKAVYYFDQSLKNGNKDAFDSIKKLCDEGNPDAMLKYAEYNLNGNKFVEKDLGEAFALYMKLADKYSVPEAQYMVANMYNRGDGCEKDTKKAKEYYMIAAEGEDGVPAAMNMVGRYYYEGWGNVEKNVEEAFKWYKKAADKGNVSSMYNLATMFESGNGCEKDIDEAKKYFKAAADQGHKQAANKYAGYCKSRTKEQFDYFRIAAEGEYGVHYAMKEVGIYYENGFGDVKQDYSKAVEWYEKANKGGYGYSNLGKLYYYGIGVNRDIERAYELFAKSDNLETMMMCDFLIDDIDNDFSFGLYLRNFGGSANSVEKSADNAKQAFEAFVEENSYILKEAKSHLNNNYYETSAATCRKYLEKILEECSIRCGIDINAPDMQENRNQQMIDKLANVGNISESDRLLLHEVRKIGNKGSHGKAVTREDAEYCVRLLENKLAGVFKNVFIYSRNIVVQNNKPCNGYYNEDRNYRGLFCYAFESDKLRISSKFRKLFAKAEENDIQAMLDLAIAFLPKNFKGNYAINDNQLFNCPIGFNNDNQHYSYDYRYYYWICRATQCATYNCIHRKFDSIPIKYIATALLETLKFFLL